MNNYPDWEAKLVTSLANKYQYLIKFVTGESTTISLPSSIALMDEKVVDLFVCNTFKKLGV